MGVISIATLVLWSLGDKHINTSGSQTEELLTYSSSCWEKNKHFLLQRTSEWLNEWMTKWMSEWRKLHPCVTHQKATLGNLLIPHSTPSSRIHLLPSLWWCPLRLLQRLNLCKQLHHYRRPHVWGWWALECIDCEDNTGSHRCPSSF